MDTPMTVTSLDTLETIEFNKDNLAIHTATAAAYRYGTRYYYALVDKYPDNEQLIQGILYPCDMQEAIDAEDGTILSYDPRYVESQEATLILELESFIKKHIARWRVSSYRTSDDYYPATEHAILCLNIVPAILNLRSKRCKTEEVHSFHLRQFLSSHFDIGEHFDYLNLKQRLYLYRNILRISKNFGKQEQFDELVQVLLTERNIPLSKFTVRHLQENDDELRPEIVAKSESLNSDVNDVELDYREVEYIFDRSRDIFSGNSYEIDKYKEQIKQSLKNSPSGVVQTKFLESNMVDYTDAAPDKVNEVLLRELVHLVYRNKYLAYCEFKNPVSGDYATLSAKDALIYLVYIAYSLSGTVPEYIPELNTNKHLLLPKPTVAEIMSVADSSLPNRERLAKSLIDSMPADEVVRSVSAFYDRGHAIYNECVRQWLLQSNTEDMNHRAEVQKMCQRMFGYGKVKLFDTDVKFSDWLERLNLPVFDYSIQDALALAMSVFSAATGLSISNAKSIPHIQRSMIALLRKLTSYSTQILVDINEDPIVLLNRVSVRHAGPNAKGLDTHHERPLISMNDVTGKGNGEFSSDKQTNVNLELVQGVHVDGITMDAIVDTSIKAIPSFDITVGLNSPVIRPDINNPNVNPLNTPFLGYEIYKSLTQEQLLSIPN